MIFIDRVLGEVDEFRHLYLTEAYTRAFEVVFARPYPVRVIDLRETLFEAFFSVVVQKREACTIAAGPRKFGLIPWTIGHAE